MRLQLKLWPLSRVRVLFSVLQARAQALYGSIAYGAGGLGGALLAGWMWEALGPALTYTASAGLALWGLALVWHGVPGDSEQAPVR